MEERGGLVGLCVLLLMSAHIIRSGTQCVSEAAPMVEYIEASGVDVIAQEIILLMECTIYDFRRSTNKIPYPISRCWLRDRNICQRRFCGKARRSRQNLSTIESI